MRLPRIDELAARVELSADEPTARLEAAIELSRELTELSDELVERFVAEARGAGLSWTEIGRLFGTSKQAAQQRYGRTALASGWAAAAQRALDRAAVEARALGHAHVGTEHALLALASDDEDLAAAVLRDLGVARAGILATPCMRPGDGAPGDPLPLMPRLKQALEHGRRIADGLGAGAAGSEHLLAGIVAVEDSMAVEILRRLGVRPGAVRAALGERLGADPRRLGGAARRRRRRLLAAR
jgi:Clp amino terminal domain, pathogenicity island component